MCSRQSLATNPKQELLVPGLQVRLAAAVGRQRRMSPEAVRLFTEGAPSEVVLPDCTAVLPAPFAAALKDCATPRSSSPPPDAFFPLPGDSPVPTCLQCSQQRCVKAGTTLQSEMSAHDCRTHVGDLGLHVKRPGLMQLSVQPIPEHLKPMAATSTHANQAVAPTRCVAVCWCLPERL